MPDEEFEFVDSVFAHLMRKENAHAYPLSAEEQAVLLIWHASGMIGNGGLQYFYEQDLDPESTACAYEKIGCKKCAEILRLSMSLFPDTLTCDMHEERIQYVENHTDLFENLSSAFWKADKEVKTLLAKYIRTYSDKIEKN